MSNTAERWWVRLIARWLARIDGVKGQVQMFSLAITAFSTFSIMLQNFGLGRFVPYIGAIAALLGAVYTYYYNEGGVRNQVSRDRADLSSNFAGPTMRIDDELTARGIHAAQKGRTLTDSEREAVSDELDEAFAEYRNGVELK